MSDAENYFGSAGDMISGSQNPKEQNDWLDQQQKARQKALEQQHKALEQPQPALSKPPAGFKPNPVEPVSTETDTPVSPILPSDTTGPDQNNHGTGLSGTVSASSDVNWTPEDAYVKLGRQRGQAMMIDQFADRKGPYRWTGHPYQGKERQEVLDRRAGCILDLSDDVQDCLFRFNCKIDPHFRQKAANALKDLKALPPVVAEPKKTTPVPTVSSSVPAEAKTKPSLTEQVARVNEPQDESMALLYQQGLKLFSEVFGEDKAVTGYGRAYPTHSDTSMTPVYRVIGQEAENALGKSNAVNGNGTRPPGHLDESMGPLEEGLFRKMNHDAVANAREALGQAEGFTYLPEHGTRKAYSFLKGIYMVPAEIKIGLYAMASFGGELIYRLVGGDPTGLRKVQQTLKQYQQEMAALKPLTLDSLYVKGRPDQTMQNVTDYLYQQLGNQLVKVPAYYLLGKVDSIAALTGMSSAKLSAQIHADILSQSGNTDPTDAVVYGVPLGLLSLLGVPAKAPFSINSPAELKAWVVSLLIDFGIGQAQEAGVQFAVDESEDRRKERKSPPQ